MTSSTGKIQRWSVSGPQVHTPPGHKAAQINKLIFDMTHFSRKSKQNFTLSYLLSLSAGDLVESRGDVLIS